MWVLFWSYLLAFGFLYSPFWYLTSKTTPPTCCLISCEAEEVVYQQLFLLEINYASRKIKWIIHIINSNWNISGTLYRNLIIVVGTFLELLVSLWLSVLSFLVSHIEDNYPHLLPYKLWSWGSSVPSVIFTWDQLCLKKD